MSVQEMITVTIVQTINSCFLFNRQDLELKEAKMNK